MVLSVDLKGYRWRDLTSEAEKVIKIIDSERLAGYVSKLADGQQCRVENLLTCGGCHVVRLVTLADGRAWVARFRIPADPISETRDDSVMTTGDALMQSEVSCLRLILQGTTVPVPEVIACGTSRDEFGMPFIIMECLPGNCAMDIHFNFIPEEHKTSFFKQMANAQVQTCNLLFPMIGSLTLTAGGDVTIGPIPGIGGPFKTATSFLQAWAVAARFPMTEYRARQGCGPYADEIWSSICDFPRELSALADRICAKNDLGPFPLFHPDFGHNNIIVDPEYNVLGVIDWERAYTMPWETVDFPTTVWETPPPMDLPTNYDDDGWPKSEELRARYHNRDQYLQAVKEAEQELNILPRLSDALGDKTLQDVATAMRFYTSNGKLGFYTRVLDPFRDV